jgi:hypothetical protein
MLPPYSFVFPFLVSVSRSSPFFPSAFCVVLSSYCP